MPRQLLTEYTIARLCCPASRTHVEVFDIRLRGLYADALKSGRTMYRVRYRLEGRYRVMTLGDACLLTLEEARQQARSVQRCVLGGNDPKRAPGGCPLGELSLSRFFAQYYLPYVRAYKRSWQTDAWLFYRHLEPLWGEQALASITAHDVAALIRRLRAQGYAPASCNRLLALLRYLYNLAIRWEMVEAHCHPARTIKNLKEDNAIERYLSPDEAQRLLAAASLSPNAQLADLVALLLYTGARRSEVLQARWCDVDGHQRLWRIPRSKSGKVRYVPLSTAAMALLERRRAARPADAPATDHVFVNPATQQPFTTFSVSFKAACRRAGLVGLRIHDLRHSFASFLVNAGHSLYEVQALLGHAHSRTTARYAHLSQTRLFTAVEDVTRQMETGLEE